MGLTWQPWTSVSQGSTTPGAPVAAIPWEGSSALFLSDPNGGVYAIKATPGYGWEAVPGRSTKPGAPITALIRGNRFTLFMADTNGEVFTTTGAPYQSWQPWTSVSQGSTTPGAPIAAIPWEESFALFLSDPNGGVYAIKATPGYGWQAVPGRSTKPGAPITALLSGNRFTLFMADANGEVVTTTGAPYQGWQPWTSVSQGSTTPGAPIAAIPWEQSFALFLSDPNGGIYAIKAIPGYGWEAVPGRSSKPGGQIAVVPWNRPPTASGSTFTEPQFLVLMVDVDGQASFSSGRPYQGWDAWASVPGISSVPGAQVMTLPQLSGSSPFTLFMANSGGEVYTTKTSGPPATPKLFVTSVMPQIIDVSWSETNPASVELDGFELSITGSGTGTKSVYAGPNIRSHSWTGLLAGVQYTLKITAFNANGYSPYSTVTATTPGVVTAASLTAGVTNLAGGNFGLLIRGSNFGKGEQVSITVDWTVGSDPTEAFPLLANTDSVVGAFQTTFTGIDPTGFCPITVPFGDPQPPQKFQVAATGLTTGKTASATAGPFTCPP